MRNAEHSIRDIILAIAANSKNGKIEGRTLLQKRVYFINELNKLDIQFEPAYYGPYSEAVAKAANSLVALGFLAETETLYPPPPGNVFPVCKYTYTLTNEGNEVYKSNEAKDREFFKRIRNTISHMSEIGEVDYASLSLAAKMYHIIKIQHPKTTKKNEIISIAQELEWELSEKAIENAADFLIGLGLIKEVSHTKI